MKSKFVYGILVIMLSFGFFGLVRGDDSLPIKAKIPSGLTSTAEEYHYEARSNNPLITGNVYYVAVNGSDSNSGTSQQPWQTVMYAIRNTQPGDTIMLKLGSVPFDEWVELKAGQGGAAGAEKVIRSAPGGMAVINGIVQIRDSYVRLEGIQIIWKNPGQRSAINVVADHVSVIGNDVSGPGYWSGIYIAANDVLIESNEVHDFGHGPDHAQSNLDHGIYVARGNRIALRNNRVHHNTAYGIHIYDHGSDAIDDLVIEGNLVYENGNKPWHKGILVSGEGGRVEDIRIHHNVVWGHREAGMIIHGSNINAEIYNNTIFEDGKTGIIAHDVKLLKVKNNLIYQTSKLFDIENITPTSVEIDYNGIYPTGSIDWLSSSLSHSEFVSLGFGSHDVLEDPQFLDLAQRDFRLQPTSSVINAGIDVGLSFAGAAPDLGAFEFDDTTTDVNDSEYQPVNFNLYQNYPNPFNPGTNISYEIITPSFVNLKIYDLNGREVRILVAEEKTPGFYSVLWDGKNARGKNVSSGVYLYSLEISKEGSDRLFSETKRMILLR